MAVDAPTHTVYIGQYKGYVTTINDQTYAVKQVYNTNGTSHLGVSSVNPSTDTLYVTLADQQSAGEINTTTTTITNALRRRRGTSGPPRPGRYARRPP
ncbi:MAG TPA: hypothetical protein VHY58_01890 [Streptosporangiaceae bacterium]|nr:hypothetical protein [Streptosporangiaceae bacterium]